MKKYLFIICALMTIQTLSAGAPKEQYKLYFGNMHSHCNYSGDIKIFRAKKGLELDPKNSAENHFRLAKQNGYDFYCLTDHSQYPEYTAEAWADVKAMADKYTDETFLGIRGYEHSENNGPDGFGHMNVYNSAYPLNALADSVSIEYLHNWLALPENSGVIVSFNHPKPDAYNTFACYNENARNHMKTFEMINGKGSKYPAFLVALSKGWKVSPVAGCDNHGHEGIAKWEARTGVWAIELTFKGWYDAVCAHRTYATFDKNLSVSYTVNNVMMGAEELKHAKKYKFDITVSDPDTNNESDRITKIEIVGVDGKVVASETFNAFGVEWKPVVKEQQDYYYVLVYNASSEEPIAFAAPVWIAK